MKSILLTCSVIACNFCKRVFAEKFQLDRHVKTVHQCVKDYDCDDCGKKFKHINGLKLHIKSIHLKIKSPFVMSVKYFTTKIKAFYTILYTLVYSLHMPI